MLYLHMFLRKLKNRSGSISVQIISKSGGKYKVVKTIGSGRTEQEIQKLEFLGKQELERLSMQPKLFVSKTDTIVDSIFELLSNASIRVVGPELIFGKIFDKIGFNEIKEELFRHLVISRLAFPLSKLKTIEYLYRYQGISLNKDTVYRFLDKLNSQLKESVEQIVFNHTKQILGGNISVVFYDMTTLYFEASDEDDLRKTGFSKDGKHSNLQIFLGLLVGLGGYAIGYDIYEGNTYEGHTLIPFLEKISSKFNLQKPVVVADSVLLSKGNVKALQEQGYEYILGARIKNESKQIKEKILETKLKDGKIKQIKKAENSRIIINYSDKQAKKDAHNRERGLKRLEKRINTGKLTKYKKDNEWDGLKGYNTNSKLSSKEIIESYANLWHIEKAFRMSKTDLRIRPIYHHLQRRIEAHICISFTAYSIYKELERILYKEKSNLSIEKAKELTHNTYEITYTLPESKHTKSKLLKMDDEQAELFEIVAKNF